MTKVHSKTCPARADDDAKCRCTPTWRAYVYNPNGRPLRKHFKSKAAAKTWKHDTEEAIRRGARPSDYVPTFAEAADELIAGMQDGSIRNRSGDAYKPAVCHLYERALAADLMPALGGYHLNEIEPKHILRLMERVQARGVSPSRLRNILMPLRVIYRRAMVTHPKARLTNPMLGVSLPAVRGKRDTIATPSEAERLLAALEPIDRVAWALAFYAGLRLGELRGLRWRDLDLKTTPGTITVARSYCNRSGRMVRPKSDAGERSVPMAGRLRAILLEYRIASERSGPDDLIVSGRTGQPVTWKTLTRRKRKAWESITGAPTTLTLHDARHTYASLMIAAGVQPKPLAEFMGHSSITVTLDRYGHLFPGARAEAAALLDRYLEAPRVKARR